MVKIYEYEYMIFSVDQWYMNGESASIDGIKI